MIENKTKTLQRITKLHPSYMSLQYPLLFPYGEDSYRIDLQCTTILLVQQIQQIRFL